MSYTLKDVEIELEDGSREMVTVCVGDGNTEFDENFEFDERIYFYFNDEQEFQESIYDMDYSNGFAVVADMGGE